MMVPFVLALAAVSLDQLDAVLFDTIDGPTWTPSAPMTSICSLMRLISVIRGPPVTRQARRTQDQAKPELHFKFGALAAESHFIPALSQADSFLGVGAVYPNRSNRVRIVKRLFIATFLSFERDTWITHDDR
jgi:hypothetical protein